MIYNWIKREEENLIMKDKHHKHPALAKPERGMYHCNEWAIYGTTCGRIESFVKGLNNRLAEKYNLTYVDADHNVEDLWDGYANWQETIFTIKGNSVE